MAWVTDVPVIDRLTAGPERTELEESWYALYEAIPSDAQADTALWELRDRVDAALAMNGFDV